MKIFINYPKLLIITICLLNIGNISAQSTASVATPATSRPVHYLSLWGETGYVTLLNQINSISVKGGPCAGLGLGYELQQNKFHFNTGIEFEWMHTAAHYNNFLQYRDMKSPYPGIIYQYKFSNCKETQNGGYVHIPLLFGGQFGRCYFMAGVKAGLPVIGQFKSTAQVSVSGYDDELEDDLHDMPNHAFSNSKVQSKGKIHYHPALTLSAETGISLDEWLAVKPRKQRGRPRKKTFKESLHYRAGIFAEYNLFNANNYSLNNTNEGQIPIFSSNPAVQGLHTVWGSEDAQDKHLNPFLVGVKFTVLYELPRKIKKPTPQPRPQSQPKPQPAVSKPTLNGSLLNAETNEKISSATIQLYGKTGEQLYAGISDSTGTFSTKLGSGTYAGNISAPGYFTCTDTLVFVKDGITIFMQPIRQNMKITLKNVFFATGKTTILSESDPALENLYEFLVINDRIRIRIIGHTDNVGSEAANMKLSAGRAQSIAEDLVSRGIEVSRIEYEGHGENEPIATNETEEGRAQNRRVEFIIL